jgi:F0F1-type ATP synthase assembly protein I
MSEEEKGYSKYAKYSSLGIQMGTIIAGLTWLGIFLDKKYQSTPLWTVILSLTSVFIALYIVIKEVIKMNKDNHEK